MSAACGITPASGDLGAYDAPESVLTMNRNECSRCAGIRISGSVASVDFSFLGGHTRHFKGQNAGCELSEAFFGEKNTNIQCLTVWLATSL